MRQALTRRWSSLFAVLLRDLRAQRMLPALAFILGLLAPAAVFLPIHGVDPSEVRDASALVAGSLLGLGGLIFLSATTLNRDYGQGRLSFYLARPINASSLWLGKMTAVFVTCTTSVLVVWLPTMVLGGRPWALLAGTQSTSRTMHSMTMPFGWRWGERFDLRMVQAEAEEEWFFYVWIVLLLAAVSHLIGVVGLLRNRFTVVDVVLFGVTVFSVAGAWSLAWRYMAERSMGFMASSLALGLLVAGAVGGWAQVRWGGTDALRAHGVQSAVLWTCIAVLVLPPVYGISQLENLTPEDLTDLDHAEAAPRGSWAVINGIHKDSGAEYRFLWNSESGSYFKLDRFKGRADDTRFSGDGTKLLFKTCEGLKALCRVEVLDLSTLDEGGGALDPSRFDEPTGTGIALDGEGWRSIEISEDGTLVAVAQNGFKSLRLYEYPGGKPGRRLKIEDGFRITDFYFAAGKLWAFARSLQNDGRKGLYVLDPQDPEAELTALEMWQGKQYRFLRKGLGIRLGEAPEADVLVDWARGLEVTLPDTEGLFLRSGRFLSDDSILLVYKGIDPKARSESAEERSAPLSEVTDATSDREELMVLESDGSIRHRIEITRRHFVGAEIQQGVVLTGHFESFRDVPETASYLERVLGPSEYWRTELWDLNRGEVIRQVDGFLPLGCSWSGPCPTLPENPGSRWLMGRDGRVHRLDPETGTVTNLLRKGS